MENRWETGQLSVSWLYTVLGKLKRRKLQAEGKYMSEFSVFFLHGLAYAGLLFLVSAGLTLVFGMMNVLNFAHAAMYMLGAYFSYTLMLHTGGQLWLPMILCPLALFVIGALTERFLLRRVHVYGHVSELLLTFGLAYVITELVKWYWGNYPLSVNISGFLGETVQLLGITYPVYRIFVLPAVPGRHYLGLNSPENQVGHRNPGRRKR